MWHTDIAFCSWLKLRIYNVIYLRIQHYTGQQWSYWGRGALYLWFYLIHIRVWRISRIISRVLILNGSKLCCSICNYYEKGFQLNKPYDEVLGAAQLSKRVPIPCPCTHPFHIQGLCLLTASLAFSQLLSYLHFEFLSNSFINHIELVH